MSYSSPFFHNFTFKIVQEEKYDINKAFPNAKYPIMIMRPSKHHLSGLTLSKINYKKLGKNWYLKKCGLFYTGDYVYSIEELMIKEFEVFQHSDSKEMNGRSNKIGNRINNKIEIISNSLSDVDPYTQDCDIKSGSQASDNLTSKIISDIQVEKDNSITEIQKNEIKSESSAPASPNTITSVVSKDQLIPLTSMAQLTSLTLTPPTPVMSVVNTSLIPTPLTPVIPIMNEEIKFSRISEIDLSTIRPSRAGVVIVTIYKGVRYYAFGIDWATGEITDFGGGVSYMKMEYDGEADADEKKISTVITSITGNDEKTSVSNDEKKNINIDEKKINTMESLELVDKKLPSNLTHLRNKVNKIKYNKRRRNKKQDKNALCGALRELKEESLDVFGSVDHNILNSSCAVYNDKMMIVFIPLNISIDDISKDFLIRLRKARRYNHRCEVRNIIWLSESVLREKLRNNKGVRGCPKMYTKVHKLLSGAINCLPFVAG